LLIILNIITAISDKATVENNLHTFIRSTKK